MPNMTRRRAVKTLTVLVGSLITFLHRASASNSEKAQKPLSELKDSNASKTALVVVDSYNDFLSEEGGAHILIKAVGNENKFVKNTLSIVAASRRANLTIAFAPHNRYEKDDFQNIKFLHPAQHQQMRSKAFAAEEFGGQFYPGLAPNPGDIVSSEHTCSSGFAGTDLHQQLNDKGISNIVLVGCISNSCIEATARSAVDLGYQVSIITDAIAAFSPIEHKHAVENTLPLVAHNLSSTKSFLAEI